uniref:Retrovirus-related Pol polyprotein from transposon TNT 1-94 n=1 Tax=Tanacetum cinerariifolium TaxID=118510 RepID=A0A6L2KL50_TANCI|nr:retrovirus-related Pol polyprotein from transposon TNT 1-94 [Tanacetum cinerariifolium]
MKPDLSYLHVFGALCYPTNDNEDLGKLKPKADIKIFVGYAPTNKAYRIYNKRTPQDSCRILLLQHIMFYKLTNDRDLLFQPMFDEYFNPPPSVFSPIRVAAALRPADLTGSPSPTSIDQDALSKSTSSTIQETQSLVIPFGVEEQFHDIEVSHLDND